MIKQYFKQALAQLRQHPLISVISIAGTALSIFLIMLVVMLQQVKVAPFSPESNRDRFYGAQNETYIEGWEKKASKLLIYKRLCKI